MAKATKENEIPETRKGELGKLLGEYRGIAGYSISQMADALCLSEKTLSNLEDEKFEDLAQPPYIRGYLRNYAKFADQEPDKLIQHYESLRGADPKELEYQFKKSAVIQTRQKKNLSPVLIQVFFLALLLAIITAIAMIPSVNSWIKTTWDSFSNQTSTQNIENTNNPSLLGSMPVPTHLPLPENENKTNDDQPENTDTEVSSTNNSDEKPADVIETNNVAINQTAEPTTPEKKPADPVTKTPTEPEPLDTSTEDTSSDNISIKLVFKEDVWLRIKDSNNKTVFEGLNPSGDSKTLNLKKPLTFRVGNAPALSLFVDGKAVDMSTFIKGSVANFTLK